MLEQYLISFGYIFVFLIIFSNGVLSTSFNSSQLTFLVSGYLASLGHFNIFLLLLIGAISRTLGNTLTYEIVRKFGLTKKVKKFFRVKDKLLEKVQKKFEKKGIVFIFFGKLISISQWFMPVLCGVSKTNRFVFILIMLITNSIWAGVFLSLGYLFGKDFSFGIYYLLIIIVISFSYIYFLFKYLKLSKEDFR